MAKQIDVDQKEPKSRRNWIWIAAAAVGSVLAAGVVLLGAYADSDQQKPVAVASSSVRPWPTPPSRDRDGDGIPDASDAYPDDPKNIPMRVPITVSCYLDEDFSKRAVFKVTFDDGGRPNLATLWAANPISCQIDDTVTPVTVLEQTAYKTSQYTDNDVRVLYTICAEVDPTDPYAEQGFVASTQQIPEINAALTLCPNHPLAMRWRQAVLRGKADADLAAQGQLFGSGTFLVGKEIKPGTYFTTDVEGCYWERQNKSGGTIDNDFILSARRVQVMIASSDYAFHSERCGEWRPVG